MIVRLARRAALAMLMLALAPMVLAAHVGSPDVIFDGKAGPYDVRVIVRVPMVVPGLADVTVRVLDGDARAVRIRPVFWRAGVNGAPSADVANPVRGTRDLYTGQLWLMARGAYSVYVTVDGPRGSGTASVPVMSVATGRLGMSPGLRLLLAALGLLLLAGLVTIAYIAAGESVVEPGRPMDTARRTRARLIGALSAPVLAVIVFGGARWWQSVDATYASRMYRPLATHTSITRQAGVSTLRFAVVDSLDGVTRLDPLVPDHGKLMHLFVIDSARMESFAHLHPAFDDTATFTATLPPLPPGTYRLFGDVAFETGQTRTLTGVVHLTRDDSLAASAVANRDPDDAWRVAPPALRRTGTATIDTLEDGSSMEWLPDSTPIRSGEEATLRFRVRDPSGAVATLEPYLGMSAHAVIAKRDGSVFVHVHPSGTVSYAAQAVFALRDRGDTTTSGRLRLQHDSMPSMSMARSGDVSFPYLFPRAGDYRIWVQVRRGGRVLTGVFELSVVG
jgi:hypothetical protein